MNACVETGRQLDRRHNRSTRRVRGTLADRPQEEREAIEWAAGYAVWCVMHGRPVGLPRLTGGER